MNNIINVLGVGIYASRNSNISVLECSLMLKDVNSLSIRIPGDGF